MARSKVGSVSVHEGEGVQARLGGRAGVSKWFALSQFPGSTEEATAAAKSAARAWLDQLAPAPSKPSSYRAKPARSKSSTLMAGVSCSRYNDRRRGDVSVRFQVLYHVAGQRRLKSFWLGPVDQLTDEDLSVGRRVAEACRSAFLRAVDAGRPFNVEAWRDWRKLLGVQVIWRDGRAGIQHPELLEDLVASSIGIEARDVVV